MTHHLLLPPAVNQPNSVKLIAALELHVCVKRKRGPALNRQGSTALLVVTTAHGTFKQAEEGLR